MEQVFRIPAPPVVEDDIDSKRTWRGPRPVVQKPKGPRWTAGEVMDGRATDRGFSEFPNESNCASTDAQ